MRKCSILKCNSLSNQIRRGYCTAHYKRYLKYGNPRIRKRREMGTGNISYNGYKRIVINGKSMLEHRFIMEKYLGRKLLPFPKEIVHHKNENRLDNKIENLEIMSLAEHLHLHHKGSKKPSSKLNILKATEARIKLPRCNKFKYDNYWNEYSEKKGRCKQPIPCPHHGT